MKHLRSYMNSEARVNVHLISYFQLLQGVPDWVLVVRIGTPIFYLYLVQLRGTKFLFLFNIASLIYFDRTDIPSERVNHA